MYYTRYRLQGRRDKEILHTIFLERMGAKSNEPIRDLEMGEGGYTLERTAASSLFEPLRTTRLEIPIISETHYMLEHILTDSEEWTAQLKINDDVIFKGLIERDLYEEEYQALPYEIRLTAVCALSRLSDQYLNLRTGKEHSEGDENSASSFIERNERGHSSLEQVIRSCLSQLGTNLPLELLTSPLKLDQYYIDPEGWRSSNKSRRNTEKAGDVLSSILRSLSLVCYQYKGKWMIEGATESPKGARKILDTKELPLYGSPSLQSNSPYGSVQINLARETHDSLFRLAPPTFPLEEISGASYLPHSYHIPIHTMGISSKVKSYAPTIKERSKGVIARLETSKASLMSSGVS